MLEEVQRDLVDWKGRGLSIMEMSHRSSTYEAIIAEAAARGATRLPSVCPVFFCQAETLPVHITDRQTIFLGDHLDSVAT